MKQANKNSIVDEIKSRCNIIDVIGDVVSLKKAGANYKGLCPFHNEKTPSFVVSENKQYFNCFGCGTRGDVIEFVQKYYNLTFQEAIEKLATREGIALDEFYKTSENKSTYYAINNEAARFFFKALRKEDNLGMRYIQKRGLSKETLYEFGIGYADEDWQSLYNHLKSKGFEEKDLLRVGLISEKNGKYFDKFRKRVIFPIVNTAGKVIGFGGRALGDDMPKYLNSQETPVFSKKNNLYGLNITKNYVNKEDQAILVEGYMDAISLYQGGVKNVAASLGTALTEHQGRLLNRYTKNIILSYDADEAGQKAAMRGGEILHREGLKTKILHITDGKDPDDFIKSKGKLAFLKLIDEALNYPDYVAQKIASTYDLEKPDNRLEFSKELADFLKKLSPMEQDIYIEKFSKDYGLSHDKLEHEVEGIEFSFDKEKETRQESSKRKEELNKEDIDITDIEKTLIKVLITDIRYLDKLKDEEDFFESEVGSKIFIVIKQLHSKDPHSEIDLLALKDNLEEKEVNALDDIKENIILGGKIDTVFDEAIRSQKIKQIEKRLEELTIAMEIADEEDRNKEESVNGKPIMEEFQELVIKQKQLRAGKNV